MQKSFPLNKSFEGGAATRWDKCKRDAAAPQHALVDENGNDADLIGDYGVERDGGISWDVVLSHVETQE